MRVLQPERESETRAPFVERSPADRDQLRIDQLSIPAICSPTVHCSLHLNDSVTALAAGHCHSQPSSHPHTAHGGQPRIHSASCYCSASTTLKPVLLSSCSSNNVHHPQPSSGPVYKPLLLSFLRPPPPSLPLPPTASKMLLTNSLVLLNARQRRRGGAASTIPSKPLTASSHVSFKRMSRLTLIRRSAASVRLLNLLDGIQSILGVTSAVLWMIATYSPFNSYNSFNWIQFILTIVYACDLILRFMVSGIVYLRTRWAVFDFITILPILWYMYLLGFYCTNNCSQATNGFVAFITALAVVWSFLTVARFLRVFKLLRLTELRSMTFLFPNALFRGLVSLIFTVLAIIVLGGGLIFLIENAWSYGEQMTFQESLYFMVSAWTQRHRGSTRIPAGRPSRNSLLMWSE